jgi:hypothetical protein
MVGSVSRRPTVLLSAGLAVGLLVGLAIPQLVRHLSPPGPRFEVLQVAAMRQPVIGFHERNARSFGPASEPMIQLKLRNVGAGKGIAICSLAINGVHRRSISLGPVGAGEIFYWQQAMHVAGGVRTVLPSGDVAPVPDINVNCSPPAFASSLRG